MRRGRRPPEHPIKPKTETGSRGAPSDEYKVGRGRPPAEYKWKPNQSGNKKGRPKGSKNRKTIVKAAEHKTFTVKKAGRSRKMTTTEIGMHNLQQEILQRDRRAFLDYLDILERYGDRDETTSSMRELLEEDRSILANMLARKTRKSVKPDGESS